MNRRSAVPPYSVDQRRPTLKWSSVMGVVRVSQGGHSVGTQEATEDVTGHAQDTHVSLLFAPTFCLISSVEILPRPVSMVSRREKNEICLCEAPEASEEVKTTGCPC